MRKPVAAAAVALATAGGAAGALAAPCEWRLSNYPLPDEDGVSLECTCGPPSLGLLDLSELNEALNPDAPEPYEGTILQTVGGVFGSWTYTMNSTICLAAQHAGLIPDPSFGAEIRIAVGAGCERYEGSTRNGIATQDTGSYARSLYFPEVSDGGCPGEEGYLPERGELGVYGAWTATSTPRDDGSWRCLAYTRAEDTGAGERPWLYLFEDHLRFAPDTELGDEDEVIAAVGGRELKMAVRRGYAYIPTAITPAMQLVADADALEIVVDSGDGAPVRYGYAVEGLRAAYAPMVEACGLNPALLGDQG